MMRWPTSVRWRLTLWYAMALAVGLAVFALTTLVVLREGLSRRSDRFLLEARSAFVAELVVEAREIPRTAEAVRAAVDEVRFDETRFFVYDDAGRLVSASDSVAGPIARTSLSSEIAVDERQLAALLTATQAAASAANGVALRSVRGDEGGHRVATGGIVIHGRPHTVAAVQSRHGVRETLELVTGAYALIIPILLGVAVAVGYALARRSLAPIAAMRDQAREIGARTLHERLPVSNPDDELGSLAGVVNELLERLEEAFAQQRRFVADASHELRTPVAIIRAEGDVVLSRQTRSEDEYRDAIGVMRDAGQRLARVVDDLFLLARADAGHQPIRRAALYLDELVSDGVRAMRALAEQRGVELELEINVDGDDGAPYNGDQELLHRLVLNLLDNAVKFSRPGGTVHVALRREGESYGLAVADEGPGISIDAQPHIFERFFREDPARSRPAHAADGSTRASGGSRDAASASGAGLGLAIARWVAEAHGGGLSLASSSALGSAFIATFPVTPGKPHG